MKNSKNIESKRSIKEFNHAALESALFNDTPPAITIFPFPTFAKLSAIAVTLRITLHRQQELPLDALQRSIDIDCKRLPEWCVGVLYQKYQELQSAWAEYLLANLQEFCSTSPRSQMSWSVLQAAGYSNLFTAPLTTEQMLWIQAQHTHAANDERTFFIQLTESLHPWINNKLYHDIQSSKKNKRTNASYDDQRRQLEKAAAEALRTT